MLGRHKGFWNFEKMKIEDLGFSFIWEGGIIIFGHLQLYD